MKQLTNYEVSAAKSLLKRGETKLAVANFLGVNTTQLEKQMSDTELVEGLQQKLLQPAHERPKDLTELILEELRK